MPSQTDLDEYRLPKLQDLPEPDRYDELPTIFQRAEADGVLAPLPKSARSFRKKKLLESRIHTIRTRLYLLNYLSRDNGKGEIDKQLEEAILKFQTDADLVRDGWVGKETWLALQELVGFEHPSHLERWFNNRNALPAITRAVKLRLFVLGFLPSRQAKGEEKLKEALEKFVIIAKGLKLHDTPLRPEIMLETISVLFDQDRIVGRLAESEENFRLVLPKDVIKKWGRRFVTKFIICCAKVELWLLGYQVQLDGKSSYKKPPRSSYLPLEYPLYHVLYTFWSEQGFSPAEAEKRASKITGPFFRRLQDIQDEGESVSDPALSDRIYRELAGNGNKTVAEQVWDQIQSIGSRIWDGIKRIWRWMKSLFKKAVHAVSTWVKNLARLTYQYAINAFPIAKRFIKLTSVTFSVLFRRTLPNSDVRHMVINRDIDFDYRVYLNPARDRAKTARLLKKFSTRTTLFNIGAHLLGFLMGTLITLIKNVSPGGGWFGLILALVRIYPRLKNLEDALDENRAFLAVI
jgi:hypothetical protein